MTNKRQNLFCRQWHGRYGFVRVEGLSAGCILVCAGIAVRVSRRAGWVLCQRPASTRRGSRTDCVRVAPLVGKSLGRPPTPTVTVIVTRSDPVPRPIRRGTIPGRPHVHHFF